MYLVSLASHRLDNENGYNYQNLISKISVLSDHENLVLISFFFFFQKLKRESLRVYKIFLLRKIVKNAKIRFYYSIFQTKKI